MHVWFMPVYIFGLKRLIYSIRGVFGVAHIQGIV